VLLLIGAVGGYRKGFLSELFSLLAIILGVLAGFKLMGEAMILLSSHYKINEKVLPYVAFAVVFVIVMILVSLLGKLLSGSLEKTVFGNVDQALGGVLGILRTGFMLSVVFWIVSSVKIELPEHWFEDAWLYPVVAKFAPAVTQWVGEIFPVFGDLFNGKD
jgi:membrane protein required for colicin V production